MKFEEAVREFDYVLKFTESYQTTEDKYLREAKALKMQTYHILVPMEKEDLVVGRVKHGLLGFSPQYGGQYTYYFHEEEAEELFETYKEHLERKDEIRCALDYWKKEQTIQKLNKRFTEKHSDLEKYKKNRRKNREGLPIWNRVYTYGKVGAYNS